VQTGAPKAVLGIVIALLVLLPETWAAVRAARANRLQSSMNLAVGSALACIGLTVPVVVLASIAFQLPLVLGLEPKEMAMLAITRLSKNLFRVNHAFHHSCSIWLCPHRIA